MKSSKRVVLSIKVPKEIEPGPGPIAAEQIFAALHSIYEKVPLYKRVLGIRGDRVSFEIVNRKKHIRFYVSTPTKYKTLIEGQIYAHYPNVEIFEEEDYVDLSEQPIEIKNKETAPKSTKKDISTKEQSLAMRTGGDFKRVDDTRTIVSTELKQTDPVPYPIKRYPQFEDRMTRIAADPMAGITSSLSKLNHLNDEAWIQMVVVPLSDSWRIKYTEILRIVSKGVFGNIEKLQNAYMDIAGTRRIWPRIVFFPLYMLLWVRRKMSGFKGGSGELSMTGKSSSGEDAYDESEEMISKTHDRESVMGACVDKVGRLLYEVNIRIGYIPANNDLKSAELKVKEIAGSFAQFNHPLMNKFAMSKMETGKHVFEMYKGRMLRPSSMGFNVEELATIWHAPTVVVQTPNIDWVKSKKLESPTDLPCAENTDPSNLTLLGKTNYRGMHETFGIKCDPDRGRHMYIIGKTGMGKTTLLENMIFDDIQAGRGVGVVDPHGDLAERVIDFVPANRTNDVIIFDPADRDHPVSFNMMESVDPNFNSIVCSGLVGIFKKIYAESWGPRLEHILRNTILSLLSYPDTTMLGITRILQDAKFRKRVVKKIEDPVVRTFWEEEFEKMQDRLRVEAISPILNKVGQFLSSPIIRNIVGQPKSSIDLRFAMDKGKIVIVNLSKGRIGEDNSSLLGAMMITKFQLDAMGRADTPEKDRIPFYLYVDEFQNFATESFATILSEARKYKLNLTMANQYIAQMPDEVRDAVFGNVGTLMSFQVGFDDAEYLSQQFAEVVMPNDLVNLNKYTIYNRLLIDGMPSRTFSADTLPPPDVEMGEDRREKIIRLSRERYSKPREMVEDKIQRWSKNTQSKELKEGEKPALKEPAKKKPKPKSKK